MKTFVYKISTKTKDEIKDPQGEVVEQISKRLEISSELRVSVGKFYQIAIEAKGKKEADAKIEKLALNVLTNPLVEQHEILEIQEV